VVERHGVRVQVLGDLRRLPPEVAAAARRCMAATAHQRRCVLNICLAYTCAEPSPCSPAGPGCPLQPSVGAPAYSAMCPRFASHAPFAACRSTQEMWQAMVAVQRQVSAGQLDPADVSMATLRRQLYTEVWALPCSQSYPEPLAGCR